MIEEGRGNIAQIKRLLKKHGHWASRSTIKRYIEEYQLDENLLEQRCDMADDYTSCLHESALKHKKEWAIKFGLNAFGHLVDFHPGESSERVRNEAKSEAREEMHEDLVLQALLEADGKTRDIVDSD